MLGLLGGVFGVFSDIDLFQGIIGATEKDYIRNRLQRQAATK